MKGTGGEGGRERTAAANPLLTKIAAPSRPARLVFLLQDLAFGGTQRQALELARCLDPARFEVQIWVLTATDDLAPLAEFHGLPVIRLGHGKRVGPAALARVGRRLKSQAVDVLVLLTAVPNMWGRILGRLAGVPVILGTCRGGASPQRQYERWLWPLADHILCNSRTLKTLLTESYGVPEARVSVIVNGVDTTYFQPGGAPANGRPQVVCVARMVPDKDHETLLTAFHHAALAYPEAALWLVGDGPLEGEVKDQVRRLGLSDQVRFLPPRGDLRPLLQQASVLALSSRVEAMPNVILEAMAMGLPVVATAVGGIPELVVPGRTGWLVAPGDVHGLAAALSQALGDAAACQAMGRAGRERARRDFSLEGMARRYEDILARLLAASRA